MSLWLTRLYLRLSAHLPLRVVHAIGSGAGWLASILPNRYREYTFYNLKYAFPGLDPKAHRQLLRASLQEDGKSFAELGIFWVRPKSDVLALVKEIHGRQHLDEARRGHQGVIVASPHLGAWELLGLYVSTLGELLTLYRPPRQHRHAVLVSGLRARFGARLIPAGARGVRQLIRAVKGGAMVGILPDQQPLGGQGVFAPFFGKPALTMTLITRLAQSTGAPVVFAYASRLSNSAGFAVHFLPAWHVDTALTPEQAATRLNEHVERCARAQPTQYQWSYKRFSERPPGDPQAYPKNRKLARRERREQKAKKHP